MQAGAAGFTSPDLTQCLVRVMVTYNRHAKWQGDPQHGANKSGPDLYETEALMEPFYEE